MEEEWRKVKGFENYSVSNHGRVRSDVSGRKSEMILSQFMRNRYKSVGLYASGKQKCFSVHRLVLAAFKENPKNKPECNHVDGKKCNNYIENLEWVTIAENHAHAARTGLSATGERHSSRTHPEKIPRGLRHWSKMRPEGVPRGNRHWSRKKPELTAKGERHGHAKLTEKEVISIRALRAGGRALSEISTMFSVSQALVSLISNNKLWKHVL